MIAREVKLAVKGLTSTELGTLVENSSETIMSTSSHSAQSSITSIVYNVFEQVMMDLLRKDVIGEM